ncbi:MAG TPA: T9SS type A sorting domain-containing protein, partial [Pelobium sp.]|nr:T9SS type A sorting domain-containing protein [Pelobium sp.]
FKEVETVNAAGTSSQTLNYEVKDATFPKGYDVVYYKLETTDLNGKISFSKVITVNVALNNNVSKLYPNPANDKITLAYHSSKQQILRFQFFDASAKLMQVQNKLIQSGINQIEFDVSLLATGMYLIKWENNTEKFIKVKN